MDLFFNQYKYILEVGITFFSINRLQQLFIICFELDEHFSQNRNNTINIHAGI